MLHYNIIESNNKLVKYKISNIYYTYELMKRGDTYLKFKNKRYVTKGVSSKVSLLLQLFMWSRIDELDISKDYLQVFNCTMYEGKQKITHIQEQPEYQREYLLNTGTPIFIGKIFVIDDGLYSTMMLSEEY